MFCEYCGEIIKGSATKCPCCGARVTAHVGGDYNSEIPTSTNVDDYYANLQEQTPPSSTYSAPDEQINNLGITRADIVLAALSIMFPVIGLIASARFFKKNQKVFGILCLAFGIIQTLSFFLPFVFVFFVGVLDSGAMSM